MLFRQITGGPKKGSTHRDKGSAAERRASLFLKKRGLKIIAQNVNYRFGELDIVAKDKEVLVFVEVKSRKNDEFGAAEYAVTPLKQKRLIKAAQAYLAQSRGLEDSEIRFDVVAETKCDMHWIRDAFRLEL